MAAWIAGTLAAPGKPEATSTGHMALVNSFLASGALTFKGLLADPSLLLSASGTQGPLFTGVFLYCSSAGASMLGERLQWWLSPCP